MCDELPRKLNAVRYQSEDACIVVLRDLLIAEQTKFDCKLHCNAHDGLWIVGLVSPGKPVLDSALVEPESVRDILRTERLDAGKDDVGPFSSPERLVCRRRRRPEGLRLPDFKGVRRVVAPGQAFFGDKVVIPVADGPAGQDTAGLSIAQPTIVVQPFGRGMPGVLTQEVTDRLKPPLCSIFIGLTKGQSTSAIRRGPFKRCPFRRVAFKRRNDGPRQELAGAIPADSCCCQEEIEGPDLLLGSAAFVEGDC